MDLDSLTMPLSITNSSWHSPSNAHAYRLLIFKELVATCLAATKRWDFDPVRRPCQPLSLSISGLQLLPQPLIRALTAPCLIDHGSFLSSTPCYLCFATRRCPPAAKPSTVALNAQPVLEGSLDLCRLAARRRWQGTLVQVPSAPQGQASAPGPSLAIRPSGCVETSARSWPAKWQRVPGWPAQAQQPWPAALCLHAAPVA